MKKKKKLRNIMKKIKKQQTWWRSEKHAESRKTVEINDKIMFCTRPNLFPIRIRSLIMVGIENSKGSVLISATFYTEIHATL